MEGERMRTWVRAQRTGGASRVRRIWREEAERQQKLAYGSEWSG